MAIELQMAPIRHEGNIAMEPYLSVAQDEKTLNDFPYLVHARTAAWLLIK